MSLRLDPMYVPEATTPTPTAWLVPGLLPRGQVVLLDGPSGVGKTRFAAALAAHATRGLLAGHPQPLPVLWLSLKESFDTLTIPQLHEHQAELRLFRANHGPRNEVGKQLDLNLAVDEQFTVFSRFLTGFRNQLIIFDEPEELYQNPKADHYDHRLFWVMMHHLAKLSGSCFLVLRRPANRLCRQSRSLAHYGDQLSTLTLSLAWHPLDRTQRLLTVTKNKRGPTGAQHLITIDGHVT